MNDINNLWKKNASDILQLLKKKEIEPAEVLLSSLKRIESINSKVNAIVTLCDKEAEETSNK